MFRTASKHVVTDAYVVADAEQTDAYVVTDATSTRNHGDRPMRFAAAARCGQRPHQLSSTAKQETMKCMTPSEVTFDKGADTG